jgi:hypothetical protein
MNMKTDDPLRNLRIAAPCPADWAGMAGNERVRHCSLCSLNVYNFAEMSAAEIRELLQRSEGRVCARLYRRADGTLITRECPTGIRALRRRVSRSVAAAVGAMLTLSGVAFGGTGHWWRPKKASSIQIKTIQIKTEASDVSQKALLRGVVVLADASPLPGVTVTLVNEATKQTFVTVSDAEGSFAFPAVDDGLFTVKAEMESFTPQTAEHLPLQTGQVAVLRIAMPLNAVLEPITVGGLAFDPVTDLPPPGVTTLPESWLEKLPH